MQDLEILTQSNSTEQKGIPIQYPANEQIIEITDADYRLVANRLLNAIGSCDYFNGTVKCCHDDFYSSLTASLVIYKTSPTPIVAMNDTTDIVPVWWEFHTTTPEGEIMNDFSFSTLKEYLFHE